MSDDYEEEGRDIDKVKAELAEARQLHEEYQTLVLDLEDELYELEHPNWRNESTDGS